MKLIVLSFLGFLLFISLNSCNQTKTNSDMNILFLHHSTGWAVWNGTKPSIIGKVIRKVSPELADKLGIKAHLPDLFDKYNKERSKNYQIHELFFPKASPYGWKNYPYDYYNIWVKNAGEEPFMEEPTLEMLTKDYQVIIFKHCYPMSNIQEDQDTSDINSEVKTLANYKLQYAALRDKLHEFPDTKFILFTGAVQVESNLTEDEAKRANEFYEWVTNEWNLPDDNIYLWDFYNLQTEGGIYFKNEYAVSSADSHPNKKFSEKVVKLLFDRIIDIIENNGNQTRKTGEKI